MVLSRILHEQRLLMENKRTYQQILNSMPYTGIGNIDDPIRTQFQEYFDWAKTQLHRQDRIIWWLKLVRISLFRDLQYQIVKDMSEKTMGMKFLSYQEQLHHPFIKTWIDKNPAMENLITRLDEKKIEEIGKDLEHFISLELPDIDRISFTWQTPDELIRPMRQIEDVWKNKRSRMQKADEGHTVILQMGDFVWLNLNKAACDAEGKAMGHCGNSPRSNTNDRVLSLRQLKGNEQYTCATFILEDDGYLGEHHGIFTAARS